MELNDWAEWSEGRHKIRITVMKITPKMCRAWLEDHDNYRRMRDNRAERYAVEMANDRWELTGDPIRFVDGHLVDGQHRCLACDKTGVSFYSVVVAIGEGAIPLIDRGLPRSSADELRRSGLVEYPSVAPATAAMVMAWKSDQLGNLGRWRNTTPPSEIESFCVANSSDLGTAIRLADRCTKELGIVRSNIAAFIFEAITVDPEDAAKFVECLVVGANLDPDDPVFALRKWINARVVKRIRTSPEEVIGASAQAWNAWRKGKSLKRITYSPSGRGPQRVHPAQLI